MQSIILTLVPENREPLNLNLNMASLFHGALMEFAESAFAEIMHAHGLKPYSQYIRRGENKGEWHWRINALTDESFDKLAVPLLNDELNTLELKKKNIKLKIIKKEIGEKITIEDLIRRFYINNSTNRRIKLRFITPCAFKTEGRYEFFPHISLIYQSLINRMDSFAAKISVKDEAAFKHLCENTRIIDYKLKSCRFSLEGVKIPSFLGEIIIRIDGPETLVSLSNLILNYALWSGIGIKTALGMGGIDIG